MNILAVDTTHGNCSVALLAGEQMLCDICEDRPGKQAERLLPIIEEVLGESDMAYEDLDAIAVNAGPGSFTGVRIGLAGIKGINLVCKTPLVGVTSFESVAWQLGDVRQNILVALDAKRGQVYCQLFDQDINNISDPQLLYYDDIVNYINDDKFILTGNGSGLVKNQLKSCNFNVINSSSMSEAKSVAYIGARKYNNGIFSHNVSPLYIRKPDAKKSAV